MTADVPPSVGGRRSCSVRSCGSTASRSTGCSLHSFPKTGQTVTVTDEHGAKEKVDRRERWAKVLQIGKVTKFDYVCSNHFTEHDYFHPVVESQRRRLKPTAVPSQNLPTLVRSRDGTHRLPPPRRSETNDRPRTEEPYRPSTEIRTESVRCRRAHDRRPIYDDKLRLGVHATTEIPVAYRRKRRCSVPQCGSRASRDGDCSFHTFPKPGRSVTVTDGRGGRATVDRRTLWARSTQIGTDVTRSTYVCSKHFTKDDFYLPDYCIQRRRLNMAAVPSQNLPTFVDRARDGMDSLPTLRPSEANDRSQTEVKVEPDPFIDIKEEPIDELLDSPPSGAIETRIGRVFVKVEAVEDQLEVEVGEDTAPRREPCHFVDVKNFPEPSVSTSSPTVEVGEDTAPRREPCHFVDVKKFPEPSVTTFSPTVEPTTVTLIQCPSCITSCSSITFLRRHLVHCRRRKFSDVKPDASKSATTR